MIALLTKKQVAEILAVSKKTIDLYCAKGKLSFIRLPAGKRFDPAVIEAFIKDRTVHHGEGYRA